jgi:hemerythrin-like domain-containing protein
MQRRIDLDAIEILVEEHKLILNGLELLTTAAEKIVRNQNPPREFFEKAATFTRDFTNKFHHYTEEIVISARSRIHSMGARRTSTPKFAGSTGISASTSRRCAVISTRRTRSSTRSSRRP